MTSSTHRSPCPAHVEQCRVRIEPVRFHRILLDGSWSPGSAGLDEELRALVPALDHVRGPVKRLLLSAGGWASRPHQIVLDTRTVSVGYLAGQPPWMMTVICTDGGTFTIGVAPLAPASGVPEGPASGQDEQLWETDGGALGSPHDRAVR